jgi:quercetin dioxygenase-like cupin family protein
MLIINHASLAHLRRGECTCRIVAGPSLGEVALQVVEWTLPPGAGANLRSQPGAFTVIVSSGTGKQRLAGEPQSFAAPCTLVVPEGTEHEVINTGSVTMQLLAIEPDVPSAMPHRPLTASASGIDALDGVLGATHSDP